MGDDHVKRGKQSTYGKKDIARDVVFLGAKIEYSGSCRGENNVETICITESCNDRAI